MPTLRFSLGAWVLALPALAEAQTTTLLSRTPEGASGGGLSLLPAISGDGRFVVFESDAADLVPGDANGFEDVFRCDLWTNTIELVSVGLSGGGGNGPSREAQVSGDGRFVVFQSYASDLVAGDGNGESDIFLRDMQLGTTIRVSVSSSGAESDGGSRYPYVSRDGRRIAFESHATNLVPGDSNGWKDVFVHDCATGVTRIVSRAWDGSDADGHSLCHSISPDGRYVGFSSLASNLVPGDTNGEMDAFVHDTESGTTTRISTSATGAEVHGISGDVNLAADGLFAVFYSTAADLVPGDTNGQGDVFVKNLQSGAIERVSISNSGEQGNWNSYYPRITPDGRYVVFFSVSDTLVLGDTNWLQDVFLHDRALGTTELVPLNDRGQQARGISRFSAISDDGRYIAFESLASNLAGLDENANVDIFLRDRVGSFHGFCAGDGTGPLACPCANSGAAGHGCANAVNPAGGLLEALGVPAADNVEFVASGLSGSLALLLQGDDELPAAVVFGRGLRCIGGNLLRLYSAPLLGPAVRIPPYDSPSIRARALALGAPIESGATRSYQAWYRDPSSNSCGNTPTNLTNAVRVLW